MLIRFRHAALHLVTVLCPRTHSLLEQMGNPTGDTIPRSEHGLMPQGCSQRPKRHRREFYLVLMPYAAPHAFRELPSNNIGRHRRSGLDCSSLLAGNISWWRSLHLVGFRVCVC